MKELFKSVIGAVAPTIGTALGGPMGGMAMNMVSQALGVKNDQKAIEQKIQTATPDELAKLKEIDNEFEIKMKELDIDLFALETADIQNARSTFSKDWTSKIIGVLVICGFLGYIFTVTLMPPDANSDTIVSLVLGYLGGLASAIISFYFGASHTSND
tara:strand:- start:2938 stop:3411 length:474 start_codon:yes stop_codon:yes gene_type:complete